jgi:hypothetical protein
MMRLTQLAAAMVGKRLSKQDAEDLKSGFAKVTRSIAKARPSTEEPETAPERKIFTRNVLVGTAIVVGIGAISATAAVITTKAVLRKL